MRRAKESGSNFMSVRQVGDHWHWREPERSHLFDQTSSSRPGERFPCVKHNNGAMDPKWWGGPGEIGVKPATDFLRSSKWVPCCPMNGRFITLNQKIEKTTLRRVFGLCHLYLFSVGLPDMLVYFVLMFEKIWISHCQWSIVYNIAEDGDLYQLSAFSIF